MPLTYGPRLVQVQPRNAYGITKSPLLVSGDFVLDLVLKRLA